MKTTLALVALAFAAVAGCNKTNPNYCDEQTPCPGGGVCDLVDHSCAAVDAAGPQCDTSADCVDEQGLPFCDMTLHACRPCGPGGPSACGGTMPVCEDFTCVGCTDDPDCPGSEACLADGSCAVETEVLYADDAGNGTECTQPMPCTVETAVTLITPAKPIIKLLPGTYDLAEPLTITDDVTVIGRGAVLLQNAAASGAVVEVRASTVELDYLTIDHGHGTTDGHGLDCGNTSSVTLRQVTIRNNEHFAIESDTCDLVIDRSHIGPNSGATAAGIHAARGSLELSRSVISDNKKGGIWVFDGTFSITNNFIVDGNGDTTSGYGAIKVDSIGTAGTHEIAFNTIVNNDTMTLTAGIQCASSGIGMTFRNNIIINNGGSPDINTDGGMCSYEYNIYASPAPLGTNLAVVPTFMGGGNYHLTSTSPGRGAADPGATLAIDYDGEPRPSPAGGAADIGADEVP